MTTWPIGLPSLGADVSDKRQDAKLRSQMDVGPAKQRRRFTSAVRDIETTLIVTGAQRATLDALYITDLEEGALPFDWTDPADGSTVAFRFVSPIEYGLAAPNPTAANRIWRAALKLEILP